MGRIGSPEIIIIVLVVLLLFGAAAIPRLARSLGQAKKEFKKGLAEGDAGEKDDTGAGTGKDNESKG